MLNAGCNKGHDFILEQVPCSFLADPAILNSDCRSYGLLGLLWHVGSPSIYNGSSDLLSKLLSSITDFPLRPLFRIQGQIQRSSSRLQNSCYHDTCA